MRKLVLAVIALWGIILYTQGITYYVSAGGNDANNGTSETTAWKSLAKVNASMASFTPGTNILFRRGDVFYGTLTITASGNASASVTFGAYGTGSEPVISGSARIPVWTLESGNIYRASCDSISGRIYNLLYNGVRQTVGRYPNTGYRQITTGGARNSLTDAALTFADNYWTGGDVAVRSSRWTTDRLNITSHVGTTLTFASNASYTLSNTLGYFILNHINAIDVTGEWAFNSAKVIYFMPPAGFNPSNALVEISYHDNGIVGNGISYVNIENLKFYNHNKHGIQLDNINYVTINNCKFKYCGVNGIDIDGGPHSKIVNNTIEDVNNLGIRVYTSDFVQIDNNTLTNIAMVPGLGQNANGQSVGIIYNTGADSYITNNKITNVGYNGIDFYYCSRVTIKNNYIMNGCQVKDDGGGIYTWGNKGKPITGGGTETPNNKVVDNIVLNVTGTKEGYYGQYDVPAGYGIYIDDRAAGIEVSGNTCAGSRMEYFFHNNQNLTICNNVALNFDASAMYFKHDKTDAPFTGLKVYKNVVATKNATAQKYVIYYKYGASVEMLADSINKIDSNYLFNPYYNEVIRVTHGALDNYYTFPNWQTSRNMDLSGKPAPARFNTSGFTSQSEFELFDYNPSTTNKVVQLSGQYVDKDGKAVSGSVTLAPFKSIILYKVKSLPTSLESPTPDGSKNKIWDVEFLNNHPDADIRIFDLTGRLVKQFKGSEITSAEYLKSKLGRMGTYLYVIDTKDNSQPLKGKFMVLR
jgi:parallel beta-helix repeat protein